MRPCIQMMALLMEGQIIRTQNLRTLKHDMEKWASGTHRLINADLELTKERDEVAKRNEVMALLMGIVRD